MNENLAETLALTVMLIVIVLLVESGLLEGILRQPWKKKAPPRSLNLERVVRDTPPMKIGGVVRGYHVPLDP